MKSVMMTKDLHPFRAGTRYPVPDEVAETIVADGAGKDPQPWPEGPASETTSVDSKQAAPRKTKPMSPRRSGQGNDLLDQTYRTK